MMGNYGNVILRTFLLLLLVSIIFFAASTNVFDVDESLSVMIREEMTDGLLVFTLIYVLLSIFLPQERLSKHGVVFIVFWSSLSFAIPNLLGTLTLTQAEGSLHYNIIVFVTLYAGSTFLLIAQKRLAGDGADPARYTVGSCFLHSDTKRKHNKIQDLKLVT